VENVVEEIAYRLLESYKIKKPIVNPFDLANKNGLKIIYFSPSKEEFKDVSGALDKAKKTIFINKEEPAERQLFTAAHELGHYLLGYKTEDVLYRLDSFSNNDDKQEREANFFAACLLIPEYMLDDVCREYQFRLRGDEVKLSKIFGVSLSFMTYRLKHLLRSKIRNTYLEEEIQEGNPFDDEFKC